MITVAELRKKLDIYDETDRVDADTNLIDTEVASVTLKIVYGPDEDRHSHTIVVFDCDTPVIAYPRF